jgi:hypothetical protein
LIAQLEPGGELKKVVKALSNHLASGGHTMCNFHHENLGKSKIDVTQFQKNLLMDMLQLIHGY